MTTIVWITFKRPYNKGTDMGTGPESNRRSRPETVDHRAEVFMNADRLLPSHLSALNVARTACMWSIRNPPEFETKNLWALKFQFEHLCSSND
jgi:hypothetical protein